LNPELLPQPAVLPQSEGGIGSTLKKIGVGAAVVGVGVLGVSGALKAVSWARGLFAFLGKGIGAIGHGAKVALMGIKNSLSTALTSGGIKLGGLLRGYGAVAGKVGAALSAAEATSMTAIGIGTGVFAAAAIGVALWLRRRADNKNKEKDTKVINDFNENVLEPIRKELFEGPQPATMAEREKKLKLYLNLIEVGFHGGTDPVSGQQISGVAAAFNRKQSVDSQAGYQAQIRQEIEKAYRAQFMPPSMQELKYTGPGKTAVG
jgi:hypothetical protein